MRYNEEITFKHGSNVVGGGFYPINLLTSLSHVLQGLCSISVPASAKSVQGVGSHLLPVVQCTYIA